MKERTTAIDQLIKNIDNVLKKNGNEAVISVADAMKELYPGISEEEIQNTLKQIQEQRGLGNTLTNSGGIS